MIWTVQLPIEEYAILEDLSLNGVVSCYVYDISTTTVREMNHGFLAVIILSPFGKEPNLTSISPEPSIHSRYCVLV